MPLQAPLLHMPVEQVADAPHCPVLSQVCTALPEHCVLPGAHVPLHAFPVHTYGQLEAAPHWPVLSQVSTPLPAQRVAPAAQEPVQAPEAQVWLVHVVPTTCVTRSTPHVATWVASLQTSAPGVCPVQRGSMGRHVPRFPPGSVSQSSPAEHVPLGDHVRGLP
jgi:hypothetical protein